MGSPQVINCTVSTLSNIEPMSVTITWMGPGENSVITDTGRIATVFTTSSDGNYTSGLQFTYLMEGDEGTYTCNVMISNASESQSVVLETLGGKF